MIVKLGNCILTVKDVLSQSDAFEHYFSYNSDEGILFLKEGVKTNGTTSREFTRSNPD